MAFLEVATMMVTWWIMAFFCTVMVWDEHECHRVGSMVKMTKEKATIRRKTSQTVSDGSTLSKSSEWLICVLKTLPHQTSSSLRQAKTTRSRCYSMAQVHWHNHRQNSQNNHVTMYKHRTLHRLTGWLPAVYSLNKQSHNQSFLSTYLQALLVWSMYNKTLA